MPSLFTADRVWSARHAPTWLLLTAAAGAVNVSAFSACRRFVSHVTGSMSNLALDLGIDFAVPLAGFILGAMASGLLIDARFHRRQRPLYARPLFVSATCIAAVGLLGHLGVFGAFGESDDTVHDLAFLFTLAFSMGLLNAAAATTTGLAVRATHMTGSATDLGVHLATAIYGRGEAQKRAAVNAGLRAAMLGSFIVGAILGSFLSEAIAYLAFLVPAGMIALAATLSFRLVDAGALSKEKAA